MNDQKIAQLIELVENSHILPEEDKIYLRVNAGKLPKIAIDDLIYQLSVSERNFERYLNAALEQDTEGTYLKKLQNTIQTVLNNAFKAEEKATGENPEAILQQLT
jgi:hypothetical protein